MAVLDLAQIVAEIALLPLQFWVVIHLALYGSLQMAVCPVLLFRELIPAAFIM